MRVTPTWWPATSRAACNLFGVSGDPNVVNTSSGDAAGGDLLSGKIAWVDGAPVTGTMPNNAAVTLTPSTSDQTIAAGYHNGAGKCAGDADLVAGNLKSGVNLFGVNGSVIQASGNAVASDVLTGRTFSNASGAGAGSMPNNGATNFAPGAAPVPLPAGYYGTSQINGDVNLVTGNIKSGATTFSVSPAVPRW